MKTYKFYFIIMIAGLFMSCDKEESSVLDGFDVTVEKTSIHVGDSVVFTLSGNPGIITFYSGLPLNDYYSSSDYIVESHYKFGFGTFVFNPIYSFEGYQSNQLRVVISHDFNGNYTVEDIKNATWQDVTESFTLADIGPTAEILTPSGAHSINAYIEESEDFYIAFHYLSLPTAENGGNSTWRIRNAYMLRESPASSSNYMVHTDFAWTFIRDGIASNRGGLATSATLGPAINMMANTTANTATTLNAWAISKKLNFTKFTNFGASFGTAIKSLVDPPLQEYGFRYNSPGEYKVVFVAKDAVAGSKVMKEITINVAE